MKVAVIGGTGTLGTEIIRQLSQSTKHYQIICISRDELKQQNLKSQFPKVKFVLADIKDKSSLQYALRGVETVFHTAALKHVDVLEENPVEAIKTNVLGTVNVAEVSMEMGIRKVVFSSTDKAVVPINTYGYTKAMAEKYLFSLNKSQSVTEFAVYRWGNVIGSRGSVVHSFKRTLFENGLIYLTHKEMTRFWIKIEDAVRFMVKTYEYASVHEPMIPDMKASTVLDLARAMADLFDCKFEYVEIGLRPGEKIHECLTSSHEACLRSDTAPHYTREELKDLLRGVI